MVCFTEPLEVDDFPFPQELDGVPYVRVVRQAEDVVIGNAGLLLSRQILGQVADGVPLGLEGSGAEGEPGGRHRVEG